ncbi:alpha/beta-hydrolase [Phlegmacium glaucopus]|nr:alpha/beta-hydrolase [Phlegmacium glaucopus]
MPTLSVGNDIVFHYTDSGPIENVEYSTLVLVHGHTFHTGIFKRILPLAGSHSLRVICLSRREYQGSTFYSTDELRAIHHGSDDERAKFLQDQGVLIALFVDGLIQTLSLSKKGGVTVAGWSLGNVFTIAMRASIGYLPDDSKQRLNAYTRRFIIFDPPSQAFGVPISPVGYNPLWDDDISEDVRGATFSKWVSSYFKHGDLSSRDFSQLAQRETDVSKAPTTDTIPLEELLTITDFVPGPKCETILAQVQFLPALKKHTAKALFDTQVREDWGGASVWFIYGEASTWNVHYAAWNLEKRVKSSEINFKLIPGFNHFPMWDEPDLFMSVMKECIVPA